MTTEYLANKMMKSRGGFIVITLDLEDGSKEGEPIGTTYATKNLDYDAVTRLLEETVQLRKKTSLKNRIPLTL